MPSVLPSWLPGAPSSALASIGNFFKTALPVAATVYTSKRENDAAKRAAKYSAPAPATVAAPARTAPVADRSYVATPARAAPGPDLGAYLTELIFGGDARAAQSGAPAGAGAPAPGSNRMPLVLLAVLGVAFVALRRKGRR